MPACRWGPAGMAAGFAVPDSVCAALYVPALILCLHMGGPTWVCFKISHLTSQTSVSIVQQLQEAVSSAASEKGLQTRLPCCMLLHDWSPALASILSQEAVSSAASEKGLQTFQAQDALAQQLAMQLQLHEAEAERQVGQHTCCGWVKVRFGVRCTTAGSWPCCCSCARGRGGAAAALSALPHRPP